MKAPAMKAKQVDLSIDTDTMQSAQSISRADRRRHVKAKHAELGLLSIAQSLGDLSQGSLSARPPRGTLPSSPNYFNETFVPPLQSSRFSSSPDDPNDVRGIDLNQDAHFSDSFGLRRSAGATDVAP